MPERLPQSHMLSIHFHPRRSATCSANLHRPALCAALLFGLVTLTPSHPSHNSKHSTLSCISWSCLPLRHTHSASLVAFHRHSRLLTFNHDRPLFVRHASTWPAGGWAARRRGLEPCGPQNSKNGHEPRHEDGACSCRRAGCVCEGPEAQSFGGVHLRRMPPQPWHPENDLEPARKPKLHRLAGECLGMQPKPVAAKTTGSYHAPCRSRARSAALQNQVVPE